MTLFMPISPSFPDFIFHQFLLSSFLESDIKKKSILLLSPLLLVPLGMMVDPPTPPLVPSFMLKLSSFKSSQVWVLSGCGEHGET